MAVTDEHSAQSLLAELEAKGRIRSRAAARAFAAVSRHTFVPTASPAEAYSDRTVRLADGSSASQPSLVADMLELLELEPGMSVLEIGAGCGYFLALVKHLVGLGTVAGIEIDAALAAQSRRALARSGAEVWVRQGDGVAGWSALAPFDRIVVSAATNAIPREWLDQLSPAGRLLVPVEFGIAQKLVLLESKAADLRVVQARDATFVPIGGAAGANAARVELGRLGDVRARVRGELGAEGELEAALERLVDVRRVAVSLSAWEFSRSFRFWLSAQEPTLVSVAARGDAVAHLGLPDLLGRCASATIVSRSPFAEAIGVWRPPDRLALLGWRRGYEQTPPEDPAPLAVFSTAAAGADARRLAALALAWSATGRNEEIDLRVVSRGTGGPLVVPAGDAAELALTVKGGQRAR
ncbi:MAG: protein-L-isoaspartate O-methyltransferase [Acidimicrobiia bacterium]